jgi:hypothetical protein
MKTTTTVVQKERAQFENDLKWSKTVPRDGLCSRGGRWLVRALAMAAAFTFCQRASAISPYPGEGNPVLCATVIATGGEVTATFITGSGCYWDYLYLNTFAAGNPNYSNAGGGSGETSNFIFVNHGSVAGQTVSLGTFPAGTELVFHVVADTSCQNFGPGPYLDWYTGPATRNADGFCHAWVDAAYTGPYGGTAVGFEDLFGLGDAGFEDLIYTFSNVTSSAVCTLICPTNITVCNTVGECGAVVTYPAPTTAGDCGTSAVVCIPPSGSFFPVGTTTVTCTAPVGTNCSFTVTVGLCTTNCPLTQGFWKNHSAAWPVSTLTLGTVSYTEAQLLKILNTSPGSSHGADASLILAHQLIAAKLNLANGSDPCPIVSIIAAADALIDSHTIPIVPKITPSSAVGAQMVALAEALDEYNEGLLTPNCAPDAPGLKALPTLRTSETTE